MIDDFIFAIVTLIVLFTVAVIRPERIRAPVGYNVEGVRPDGSTTIRVAPPRSCGEPIPPNNQPCTHRDRSFGARIYCTGGTLPIVVDERTIGCQRGGYRQ